MSISPAEFDRFHLGDFGSADGDEAVSVAGQQTDVTFSLKALRVSVCVARSVACTSCLFVCLFAGLMLPSSLN
jgi:hypothetical protein